MIRLARHRLVLAVLMLAVSPFTYYFIRTGQGLPSGDRTIGLSAMADGWHYDSGAANPTLAIYAGTSVTMFLYNNDGARHRLVIDSSPPISSPDFTVQGQTIRISFDTPSPPGTYSYCDFYNPAACGIFHVKLRGDVNGDDRVTSTDLDIVTANFGSSLNPSWNTADRVYLDGRVDYTDLAIESFYFGSSGPWPEPYHPDLNGDGAVNIFDLATVSGQFGKTAPAPFDNPNQGPDTNYDNIVDHADLDTVFSHMAGPGTATILIHEHTDTAAEMTAFESGNIDMADSAVPSTFLNAWIGPAASSRSILTRGNVTASKYAELGVFQIDINDGTTPTSDQSLRRAVGYLVDRQQIVNVFAGGLAIPACAATAASQPGAKSCLQLGYPTSVGDFSPTKAIQVLFEGGWRDANSNGVLEAPGGGEPTLVFIVRNDDPILRQTGDLLTSALGNLPGSFTAKAGGTVTVCPATCSIRVDERLLPQTDATDIVFQSPWNDWNLYTGGSILDPEPDHMAFLYGSEFAPTGCGGLWPGGFPRNYLCNVDPAADALMQGLVTGPTFADIISSAQSAQTYFWGYSTSKITGTVPSVPLYTLVGYKAGWLRDRGTFPLRTDGSVGTSSDPSSLRACWTGYIGQETGTGLDNLATLTGLYPDNCMSNPGFAQFRGSPGSTLDFGFMTNVDGLNIVNSESQWDRLAMRQTYDSCLTRNPVNVAQIVPSGLCESFGQSSYFNTALGRQGVLGVYKFRNGVRWSNGQFATALDFKFSLEYVRCNFGWNLPLVDHVYDSDGNPCNGMDGIVVEGADPATGIGGKATVYFDDLGALMMQKAGFLPVVAQHVWCPTWPNRDPDLDGIDFDLTCPYPVPSLFPDFGADAAGAPDQDFDDDRFAPPLPVHVGTGTYTITGCTGLNCIVTITLSANPFYSEETRWWNVPAEISLYADTNRDGQITQADLDLLNAVGPDDIRFDVDYRIAVKGSEIVTNAFGPGTINVSLYGPGIDDLDRYILKRLVFEETQLGNPITWPPSRRMTYNWPEVTRDNAVDVNDLIHVYIRMFMDPKAGYDGVWTQLRSDGLSEPLVYEIVNDGIYQSGEPIINGGWAPSPAIGDVLKDDPNLKFVDSNDNNVRDLGEAVVHDTNGNGLYDTGEPVVKGTGTAPPAATPLKDDPGIKYNESSLHDVNYDMAIDIDDLIITYLRQFTKPAGVL